MTDRLATALRDGPLLLDAAMGTRLIAQGLRLEHDDPAFWNLSRPEAVTDVHQRDVEAGSRALVTNTFGASRPWLARFGRAGEVRAINRSAVALARRAAGPDRLVLGSIGPAAADEPDGSLEQAEALAEAGVDAILFETHRADAAALALRRVRPALPFLPLVVSLSAWPDDLAETARRLAGLGASALGVNCQADLAAVLSLARLLRSVTDLPLLFKPSAGLPGTPLTGPAKFAEALAPLAGLGPVLAGGCCGTTESHVAALRDAWYPVRRKGRSDPPGRVEPDRR